MDLDFWILTIGTILAFAIALTALEAAYGYVRKRNHKRKTEDKLHQMDITKDI